MFDKFGEKTNLHGTQAKSDKTFSFRAFYSDLIFISVSHSEDISDVTSTVTQYSWLAKSDKNKRND